MGDIRLLYQRLRELRWPVLAREVGNFPLYDSLLAGCADRVASGGVIEVSKVPEPDEDTLTYMNMLRGKPELSEDERALLEYFDVLEEIRFSLSGVRS